MPLKIVERKRKAVYIYFLIGIFSLLGFIPHSFSLDQHFMAFTFPSGNCKSIFLAMYYFRGIRETPEQFCT